MNRSSLRFPRQSHPSLPELAAWLDHQNDNDVLGLNMPSPSESALLAEPADPTAVPRLHTATPHPQMVRSFGAHRFFLHLVDQWRHDQALAFNAQARPAFIALLSLLQTRPMTDGIKVGELRASLQCLASLKHPPAAPVSEALSQALLILGDNADFSQETVTQFKALAQLLDKVLIGQASADELDRMNPDLVDEFHLLPGVWDAFKQRHRPSAPQ